VRFCPIHQAGHNPLPLLEWLVVKGFLSSTEQRGVELGLVPSFFSPFKSGFSIKETLLNFSPDVFSFSAV